MHAHGHALCGVPLALDQGQVHGLARLVAEGVHGELAERRGDLARSHLVHQRLGAAAVFDQVGDRADLDAVLGRKQLQVGQAGHGAVVLHHLADHGGGAAAGHGGQVAAGLGVAGAHEHAAIHRLQREDVAGLHQVGSLGVGGHGGLHGARAVGGADAGGHALGRLDGDGEGGAHLGAVARHHGRQAQALAAFAREGQADQAAAEARHEVDGLGRDMVRGDHEVAFVLAVFLIDEDHDAAGAQLGHDVLDGRDGRGREGGGHAGLSDGPCGPGRCAFPGGRATGVPPKNGDAAPAARRRDARSRSGQF